MTNQLLSVDRCEACNGRGWHGGWMSQCSACHGTGRLFPPAHPDIEAFLRHIFETKEEYLDAALLVFADWLDEHDDQWDRHGCIRRMVKNPPRVEISMLAFMDNMERGRELAQRYIDAHFHPTVRRQEEADLRNRRVIIWQDKKAVIASMFKVHSYRTLGPTMQEYFAKHGGGWR